MLQPKRTKYRKMHRGHRRGNAQTGNQVAFGDFGLKATSTAWVTARQIEAARRAITRHFRRGGQVWIRVFPDKPVSKKPTEPQTAKEWLEKAFVDHDPADGAPKVGNIGYV